MSASGLKVGKKCMAQQIYNKQFMMRRNIDTNFVERRKLTAASLKNAFLRQIPISLEHPVYIVFQIASVASLLVSVPSEGDSIKTDLRAGFMKTVRFSRQYFTDGESFFFHAQNLQSFYLSLSFSPEWITTVPIITLLPKSRWRCARSW